MIVVATEAEYKRFGSDEEKTIITGVGYGNVFKALSDVPRDTPIVNIGYAGSNCIPKGRICVIGECRHYHPNVDYKEATYKLLGAYVCYTSDDFVTSTEITHPAVFDMELYAILSMGFTNVTAIKIISDNLSLTEYENTTNIKEN